MAAESVPSITRRGNDNYGSQQYFTQCNVPLSTKVLFSRCYDTAW